MNSTSVKLKPTGDIVLHAHAVVHEQTYDAKNSNYINIQIEVDRDLYIGSNSTSR